MPLAAPLSCWGLPGRQQVRAREVSWTKAFLSFSDIHYLADSCFNTKRGSLSLFCFQAWTNYKKRRE